MFPNHSSTRLARPRRRARGPRRDCCATGATTASAQATHGVPAGRGRRDRERERDDDRHDLRLRDVTVGGPRAGRPSRSPGRSRSTRPTRRPPRRPRTPAAKASAASQIAQTSLESPIVGSTSRAAAATPRAALAQLQSGGPIVASSGTAAAAHLPTSAASQPDRRSSRRITQLRADKRQVRTAGSTVQINAPGVHRLHQPDRGPPPGPRTPGRPRIGPQPRRGRIARVADLRRTPADTIPARPRSPSGPGQHDALRKRLGRPAGGSSLLGIDALFTIAALLVGAAWRRRSWDLPVLARQSALLSLALDRPG